MGEGRGVIHIYISRDHSCEPLAIADEDRQSYLPIKTIEIVDDGIGFTEVNFHSFDTVYSQHKISVGGKGVGRLTWLKAFQTVEVESVFHTDGDMMQRTFKFNAEHQGVYEPKLTLSEAAEYRTRIRLLDLRPDYANARRMPKRTASLASDIIRHNLMFFVKGLAPIINIHDGEQTINLNEIYVDEFESEIDNDFVEVNGERFKLRFVKMRKSQSKRHKLHLCAINRDVCSDYIDNFVPDFSKKLTDEDGSEYVLLAYVNSHFLDKHVNEDRTDFNLPSNGLNLLITKEELYNSIALRAAEHSGIALQKIRTDKTAFIHKYISSEAPEYMFILNERYKHYLDSIPSDINEKNALEHIIRVKNRIENDHRQKAKEILAPGIITTAQLPEYQEKLRSFVEDENVIGKASLAKYISHRRVILDILKSQIKYRDGEDSYHLEKELHTIIHPLRTTSTDVSDVYNQNLWIIDERLTYHHFLVSDQSFSSMQIRNNDTNISRPDILTLFDNPMVFSEDESNFQSIVLVEFKRPGRDDYNSGDNPIAQINKYIRHLQTGDAKTIDGRQIDNNNLRFYVYIIADMFKSLKTILEDHDFIPQIDGNGYYRYHDKYRAYIEVISYDKLLENAEKRNRVLFDMLHLPRK